MNWWEHCGSLYCSEARIVSADTISRERVGEDVVSGDSGKSAWKVTMPSKRCPLKQGTPIQFSAFEGGPTKVVAPATWSTVAAVCCTRKVTAERFDSVRKWFGNRGSSASKPVGLIDTARRGQNSGDFSSSTCVGNGSQTMRPKSTAEAAAKARFTFCKDCSMTSGAASFSTNCWCVLLSCWACAERSSNTFHTECCLTSRSCWPSIVITRRSEKPSANI